jgi:hypothetical protein
MAKGLTPEQILQLPAAVDIPTAGKVFGYGKSKAYQMARLGEFPVPLLPFGKSFRVTRASICAVLGIEVPPVAVQPSAERDAA